jgi:hypothetical protein
MKNGTRVILLIAGIFAFGIRPALVAAEGDTYAAIAFSPSTVHWAYVNGEKTKEGALAHALKKCHRSDALTNWCKNSYIALAISDRSHGGWGSSFGVTCEIARSKAVAECIANNNPDGRVVLCVSSRGD